MIKIKKIDEEINLVFKSMKQLKDSGIEPKDEAVGRKHIKNLAWLRQIKMYLETKPRLGFVEEERERVIHRIKLIEEGVEHIRKAYKKECTPMKEEIKEYRAMNQFQKLKGQLKTLNFILE